MPLPRDVILMVGDRSWTQSLDYEGLPFSYRRCFSMGHLASNCSLSCRRGFSTWWKDATEAHLKINTSEYDSIDSSQEEDVSSQDELPLTVDEASIDPLVTILWPLPPLWLLHLLLLLCNSALLLVILLLLLFCNNSLLLFCSNTLVTLQGPALLIFL